MGKQKYTRDDIIRALKHTDSTSDKPVGTSALKEMGISPHWVRKLFPGESLTEVKREHGIRLSPQEIHRSDDELLEMLDEVISQEKSIPCWTVLGHQTGIAEGTWKNRLGKTRNCSKEDVYRRYEQWLRVSKPLSPNLKIVRGFLDPPEMSETSRAIRDPARSPKRQARTYQKGDGRVYGRPFHFGDLTYEPTNEQGVVFLFAMVSRTLGFDSVEYLGTDFPDCEGKRRIGSKRQLQHVRIEFEFRSSNYDHPLEGCDVIVCWEDNWKECPLEVIELRKEVKALRDRPEFKS